MRLIEAVRILALLTLGFIALSIFTIINSIVITSSDEALRSFVWYFRALMVATVVVLVMVVYDMLTQK